MANLLVINDDGVKSLLWSKLCDALEATGHTVYGVAPATDQSWIACSQTVTRKIPPAKGIALRRWSIEGTPADCVGVAPYLGKEKFDAVVSGINIGVNTRLPMVLASGTVGAASMAAMMNLKSIAFSYAMPQKFSSEAKKNGGIVPQTAAATEAMIKHCIRRINLLIEEKEVFGRVYNVNFPATVNDNTPWQSASTALALAEQFFEQLPGNKGFKHFPRFSDPINTDENEFSVIKAGKISESVLDWAKITMEGSIHPSQGLPRPIQVV